MGLLKKPTVIGFTQFSKRNEIRVIINNYGAERDIISQNGIGEV